ATAGWGAEPSATPAAIPAAGPAAAPAATPAGPLPAAAPVAPAAGPLPAAAGAASATLHQAPPSRLHGRHAGDDRNDRSKRSPRVVTACNSTIACGQTIQGALVEACQFDDGAAFDLFSFNGTAGQSVTFTATSGDFSLFLDLEEPLTF